VVRAELEADLVVSLAGGAVRDGVSACLLHGAHHPFDDARARERGAEQVLALVDGVGADGGEDVIADERLAEVGLHVVGGAASERFLLERLELRALAEIGAPGDDLTAVGLFEPAEDDARIQAA
jgi:hypothetical protein